MPRAALIAFLLLSTPLLAASSAGADARGFVENRGQLPDAVLFHASHGAVDVYLTADAIVLDRPLTAPGGTRRAATWLRFEGAGTAARIEGRGPLVTTRHYFRGNDPAGWTTGVREFADVVYWDLLPGAAVTVALTDRGLRYRLDAAGDPTMPRVGPTLTGAGGDIRHHMDDDGRGGAVVWQSDDGTRDNPDGLTWSTFLGSAGGEKCLAVRRAANGNLVITGRTNSPDFPTTVGSYDQEHAGDNDVYVAELSADGTELIWSTLIGGLDYEVGSGLDIAANGDVVVAGNTSSTDFPTTVGAYQPSQPGSRDGWALRLGPTGSALVWSTFLGGGGIDDAISVRLDDDERVIVAGNTASLDFPTTPGAYDRFHNGDWDVFLACLEADGAGMAWSTLVGGSGMDAVFEMEQDATGALAVVGQTASANFPVTPGVLDTVHDGGFDVFVATMSADGATLAWSTFLGGDADEQARGIAFDEAGRPLVCGMTYSSGFPTTAGAYATESAGSADAFVTALAPGATGLRWSTLLGGGSIDGAHAMATIPGGGVVVTGTTQSGDFPTTAGAFSNQWGGGIDIFVSALGPGGGALGLSTFLGGAYRDDVYAILLDSAQEIVIVGHSDSPTFPTTPGAYDQVHGGQADAIICSLPLDPASVPVADLPPAAGFSLRNHPNPFNPATVIAWDLPRPASVSLHVYDLAGRRLRTLLAEQAFGAGRGEMAWNGRDGRGRELPAGIYLARLTVDGAAVTSSLTLVK